MQGIELVAIFSLLSSLFSLFSAPSSLLSSALDSRNRIPAFLQGIMRPRGVLHCKNEAIRGVAKKPEKMRRFGPAAVLGPPSAYVESENSFFKKASQLRTFFLGAFWLPSRWPRDTVEMQGIELATLFLAPSDFQNFCERDSRKLEGVFGFLIEVATGPCKNAVNLACGHFRAPF